MPNNWIVKQTNAKGSLGKSAMQASEQAVKVATMYQTTLVVKEDGKIKELSPRQMRTRLAKLKA